MKSVCFRKFLCRYNSFQTVYINVKITFFICFSYSCSNNHFFYLFKFVKNIFLFTFSNLLNNYLLGILNGISFKSFSINFYIHNISKIYSSFYGTCIFKTYFFFRFSNLFNNCSSGKNFYFPCFPIYCDFCIIFFSIIFLICCKQCRFYCFQ